MADFGKTLREHRKNLLLTQSEYAERLGVSIATITGWERGVRTPGIALGRKLVADGVDRETVLEAVQTTASEVAA